MALPNSENTPTFQPSLNVMDGRNIQLRNPWRRYWARALDNVLVLLSAIPSLLIASIAIKVFCALAGFTGGEDAMEMVYNVLAFVLFVTFAIVYDGVFLATWGTTPGKRLLGLIVRDAQGEKLGWGRSFFRALWANGLIGIFAIIPLASFIFLLYQKSRLCRTGFATWDQPDETLVYRI